MISYENLKKNFKRLADNRTLFHAYLFFGEPQVAKFSFALALTNYLENKKFTKPSKVLNELSIISPIEQTIGIDQVRTLKDFLYKKPFFSEYRAAIIKEAECLTPEAQNAMLKILEEPPAHGLIILISSFPENLFPPILSRVQKIYFPRPPQIKPISTKNTEIEKIALQFLKGSPRKLNQIELRGSFKQHQLINLINDGQNLDQFFEILIAELKKDLIKNSGFLKKTLRCLTTIKQINVNKKLQLECLQTKK